MKDTTRKEAVGSEHPVLMDERRRENELNYVYKYSIPGIFSLMSLLLLLLVEGVVGTLS